MVFPTRRSKVRFHSKGPLDFDSLSIYCSRGGTANGGVSRAERAVVVRTRRSKVRFIRRDLWTLMRYLLDGQKRCCKIGKSLNLRRGKEGEVCESKIQHPSFLGCMVGIRRIFEPSNAAATSFIGGVVIFLFLLVSSPVHLWSLVCLFCSRMRGTSEGHEWTFGPIRSLGFSI